MKIRPYQPADEEAVIAVWRQCNLVVPWNDPHKDIRRKMAVRPELFLVGVLGEEVVGTVMVGYDGHRGWINYLAVAPAHQRKGLGRLLMEEAERLLRALDCPKVNLQVRAANTVVIDFYRRLGYEVEERVSMGKRLEAD